MDFSQVGKSIMSRKSVRNRNSLAYQDSIYED